MITDDGNACTNDICMAGVESHPAKVNGTVCEDGLFCTGNDTCQSGACQSGTPKGISDGITCTNDFCDEVNDKIVHAADDAKCNDGLFCNGFETCSATKGCQAGTPPVTNDGVACTNDSCDETNDKVVHATDSTKCNDNNACTSDFCTSQGCSTMLVDCGDGNTCTVDSCNATTGCAHANIGSGSLNACGGCTTLSHTPGAACTAGSGACAGSGTYVCNANGTDVTCNATPKVDGTTIADDGNVCTHDFCSAGAESHPVKANGTGCSDGNLCTQTDTCQGGVCTGTNPKTCTALDQCHTAGICAPATGLCSNPNKANGTSCNDGNACTQTDSCQSGTCTGTNPKVCTALDVCHNVGICNTSTGICSNPNKPDGTSCVDGTVCNGNETCQLGTCTAGTALTCNDGDSCTTDSCNAQTGCVFTGSCNTSNLTAVWAGEGGDKIAQEELRASADANAVINSVWDGSKIQVFGAKNEMVNFNVVLEAATSNAANVSVSLGELDGPSGTVLHYKSASGDGLYNWVGREIELFYVRYLEIKGLSAFCCQKYDERHIPERLRRPYDGFGIGSGAWTDRPDHNRHYPDIAVPLELNSSFIVASGQNQSVWVDVYIPTTSPAGLYTGSLLVKENGTTTKTIPVELTVRNFALPEEPTSKTMLFFGYPYVNDRYFHEKYPYTVQDVSDMHAVRNRHFMMAHRHKISLIDADLDNDVWTNDYPHPEWVSRLSGTLFTSANGYEGPGTNTGNNIYSIGTYGSWGWLNALSVQYGYVNQWGEVDLSKLAAAHANGTLPADYITQAKAIMATRSNNWVNWFQANVPGAEYFLYLIDESGSYEMTEDWAHWIEEGGSGLMSMATNAIIDTVTNIPSLDIPTSGMYVGDPSKWQSAVDQYEADASKRVYFYNGGRPASGSFMTEDDGVALRELPWGQYKKGVDRWFYWESTYYNDFQSGRGDLDLFHDAHTFGYTNATPDPELGENGYNYSNGDGVLFYPGTDRINTADSYGVKGPLASLRLKYWRRGIQDVDYLELARQKDPVKTQQIIDQIVPKALWEYGVGDPNDPTWVRTDISWSNDPDVWEAARKQLADIIEGQ